MSKLQHRRPPRLGFTLVELAVVIMILGILAGVAAPRLSDVGRHAGCQAAVSEVEAIFKAAELYAAHEGVLPPDAPRRRTPSGFEQFLDPAVLAEASPVGGTYDWQGPGNNHSMLGVRIHDPDAGSAAEVDRLVDDGNGGTGFVRYGGGYLDFLLESN